MDADEPLYDNFISICLSMIIDNSIVINMCLQAPSAQKEMKHKVAL